MDKNGKLVSVIMPVYNSEKYLEEALVSIQEQSYKNLEVILVDDGSKDSSPEICDRFASIDTRFKVIHQSNSGPSAARNRGLDEATGDYVTFVDNDDLLHRDFVKELYSLCDDNECDIALTRIHAFYDGEQLPQGRGESKLRYMDARELSEQLLDMGWNGIAVTMAKVFKKSLYDSIRFNEERIIGDDDSTMYLVYWNAQKAVLNNETLYFYRSKRKGSITHSNYKLSWLTGVEAFKERMEFYYSKNEKILYAKAVRNYCRRMAENYVQISNHFPEEKGKLKELKNKMQKYAIKLLFLRGNTFKQKISAIMFAWMPTMWNKLYMKL